jgi:hypothetical protein
LKLQHPEKWNKIKDLFEDRVNLVLAKSKIIELALRMAI